jgi:hypothetical protein
LEINFVHVPTNKVLKRARFYISADDSIADWIQKHPTFKNGCWPLGLMNLHQWFWKIKFVEVHGHRELKGGAVDPNVGTTLMPIGIFKQCSFIMGSVKYSTIFYFPRNTPTPDGSFIANA